MSWTELLVARQVIRHRPRPRELAHRRVVVDRYLADARQETVSLDGRFAFAYSAAHELATMVISCAGYRVKGLGAHETVFSL